MGTKRIEEKEANVRRLDVKKRIGKSRYSEKK